MHIRNTYPLAYVYLYLYVRICLEIAVRIGTVTHKIGSCSPHTHKHKLKLKSKLHFVRHQSFIRFWIRLLPLFFFLLLFFLLSVFAYNLCTGMPEFRLYIENAINILVFFAWKFLYN